ncbi:MAG: rhomboid family intramembrane serine protease [Chloroflexi bacterium]|nr:rhomboid family intramembrane serine protease [Chloroflexota bacterium]
MIPIGDANPTRRLPITNWTLIAINVIVFIFEISLRPRQLDALIQTWGVIPGNVFLALADPIEAPLSIWATLVTSQFLHAGWAHIIGNMLFLWVFGDNIEEVLGHLGYLVFYLVSGIAAGIVQVVVSGPIPIPAIGASGAIAGVLGAYIVLYPWARISILFPLFILFWTIEVPAIIVIGWWFIQQFFYGVGVLSSAAASGIAIWAHIGGFVAGLVLILPFIGRARRRRRIPQYYSEWHY